MKLPTIITSSVIRSTNKGESHGGVYVINLETNKQKQVIDWDDETIDWSGRGKERGLRGIEFYDNKLYIAASDKIFVYDKNFNMLNSFQNRYLKYCHEIFVEGSKMYITSTGYDSILVFDLKIEKFIKGYCLRYGSILKYGKIRKAIQKLIYNLKPNMFIYDPTKNRGPKFNDQLHFNSVYVENDIIYCASRRDNKLFKIKNDELFIYGKIPYLTHNAIPYRNGILFNDTAKNKISYINLKNEIINCFPIIFYDENKLKNSDIPNDYARQAFVRGLCYKDNYIIVGSSPATISVYDITNNKKIKSINISIDIRNSIHGLEIWPY